MKASEANLDKIRGTLIGTVKSYAQIRLQTLAE